MEFPHSNVLRSLKLPLFSWGNFPCAGACIWGVRQREGAGKKLYLNRNGHGNLEGVHREPDWKGSGEEKLVIWFVGLLECPFDRSKIWQAQTFFPSPFRLSRLPFLVGGPKEKNFILWPRLYSLSLTGRKKKKIKERNRWVGHT